MPVFFLLLISCRGTEDVTIENLAQGSKLNSYRMISVTGIRDGDRLPVRVVFEGSSGKLLLDLRFRIGVPTRLESGQYRWEREDQVQEGRVRASSVTFLGGQSDNPNLGGVFELVSPEGMALYKVTLPTSEVKRPASKTPLVTPSH